VNHHKDRLTLNLLLGGGGGFIWFIVGTIFWKLTKTEKLRDLRHIFRSKSHYDRRPVGQCVLVSSPVWGSCPDVNISCLRQQLAVLCRNYAHILLHAGRYRTLLISFECGYKHHYDPFIETIVKKYQLKLQDKITIINPYSFLRIITEFIL
jgi:hypothetical protein